MAIWVLVSFGIHDGGPEISAFWHEAITSWWVLARAGQRREEEAEPEPQEVLPSCSLSLAAPLWAQPHSFSSEVFCLSCDLLSWHINPIVGALLSPQEPLGESQFGPFCSELRSPSET